MSHETNGCSRPRMVPPLSETFMYEVVRDTLCGFDHAAIERAVYEMKAAFHRR